METDYSPLPAMIIDEGKIFISNDNGENYLPVLEIFLLRNHDEE